MFTDTNGGRALARGFCTRVKHFRAQFFFLYKQQIKKNVFRFQKLKKSTRVPIDHRCSIKSCGG